MRYSFNKHPSLGLRLKIKRPLTRQEKANKLKCNERHEIAPHYWGTLISLNSTYIESIDVNYQRKGFMPVVLTVMLALSSPMMYLTIIDPPSLHEIQGSPVGFLLFTSFFIFMICSCMYLLLQEAFTYTHCPIRLNRKTRMVHVFRRNGTILTVPWEDVHFVITKTQWMGIGKSYIAAHVLDESRQIIQETFVLGGYLTPREEITLSIWEFFRRYMEEGPEFIAADKLLYCLPIDKQKESFDLGDTMIRFSQWVPGTPVMGDFMSIILFFESLARWVSTMTCRIPRWPQEIENVCRIEPDDPYVRDGSTNDVRASLAPAELGFR